MKLFENGGFLRQRNGLNSLDTIKQLARIINIPEFKFQIKTELITTLCQNSKTLKNLLFVNLLDDLHRPIVILLNKAGGLHATVLKARSKESIRSCKVKNTLLFNSDEMWL